VSEKESVKDFIMLFLPSMTLFIHAIWCLSEGKIVLQGGTKLLYSENPTKFIVLVTFEILLSLFVLYRFIFSKAEVSSKR